ncbi:hypothetical protein F2P81_002766 [Scophthalmus maximus]|uniref:Uncharacterized protein n=1 Tax=Scophthalmus maximus TaxID=52904 RepID=A0A6A4THR1_SCOMX|nr:hypothetical protein F2P81_002766 [Scophthalmus maximus]
MYKSANVSAVHAQPPPVHVSNGSDQQMAVLTCKTDSRPVMERRGTFPSWEPEWTFFPPLCRHNPESPTDKEEPPGPDLHL